MKALNYLYLLLFISFFSACNDNDLETLQPQNAEEAVISISLDNILPVNMNTRANPAPSAVSKPTKLAEVLSYIQDLNIRVHFKDGIKIKEKTYLNIFCYNGDIVVGNKGNASYIGTSDLTNFNSQSTTAENKHIKLHLGDITVNDIAYVEAIANAGYNLEEEDFNTVQENQSYDFAANGLCMMYGYADASSGKVTHGENTCEQFNLTLKRTRALMTFVVNASGLKDGVEITPKVVRLRNLPDACNVTSLIPHKLPDGTQINSNKIEEMDPVPSDPKKLYSVDIVREQHLNEVVLTNKAGSDKYGEHAYKGKDLPTKFFPLYMYENMQGTHGDVSKGEVTKYPEGITTVAEAKDRTKNYKYSYIELEADYKYKENNTVKVSGTIVYRFFLGENSTNNFNIEGNHYYRLNLNLSGFGGASEDGKVEGGKLVVNDKDVSWRVDMNTKDWGFEKDQFDFDGHYVYGSVGVIGENWKFNRVLKGDGSLLSGDQSWIVLNIKKSSGVDWANPTQLVSDKKAPLNIVNGQLAFQIEPMTYMPGTGGTLDPSGHFGKDTYLQKVNYREMNIEVERLDEKGNVYNPAQTQLIKVRQYAPITVTYLNSNNEEDFIFMERFEEYNKDSQGNLIFGYPWKYNNNDLKNQYYVNSGQSGDYYSIGDNPSRVGTGTNTLLLLPTNDGYGNPVNQEGKGSAAFYCFQKGIKQFQGNDAEYYILPSAKMMEAMFKKAEAYDKAWGPFEPLHIHEDYWTSSVRANSRTQTVYYDGVNKIFVNTSQNTSNRNSIKRIRAVYNHQFTN